VKHDGEYSGRAPARGACALNRRALLQVFCASTLSPLASAVEPHCSRNGQDNSLEHYQFVMFSPMAQKLLEAAMELIIPADAHSPGAKDARVPAFADLVVSTSDDVTRSAWGEGLRALSEAAKESSLESALASAAGEEEHPRSPLGKFFVLLKAMTVTGYYTSWIGIHQDLKYLGNDYKTSPPRCDHPEHQ
jgi:hypothetical protein